MKREIFQCRFDGSIPADDVLSVLAIAGAAAGLRHGSSTLQRDGRHRVDDKMRLVEVDASTPFGKTMAHFFRVLMAEMYIDQEYTMRWRAMTSDERSAIRLYRKCLERGEPL